MKVDKKNLFYALNNSVKDLQQGIDMHCCLLRSMLAEQLDENSLQSFLGDCPQCTREQVLKDAIKEAIGVLEESRKSFKSKQLESLRKKLTAVLIDTQ